MRLDFFRPILTDIVFTQGIISKTEFTESLTLHFHFLNGDDVSKMVDAAVEEIGELVDDNIPYKDLFTEVPFIQNIL